MTVLGFPAAVYVVGITSLLFYEGGNPQNLFLLVGTGFLALGIYMFHRTNVVAVLPMQKRHQLALQHRCALLIISSICLAISISVFALYKPIALLLIAGSVVGIVVYGKRHITKPLRNYLYVKPWAVGVSIALFAWALNDFSNRALVIFGFAMLCSADALICDIVDRDYDAATDCLTFAKKFGEHSTWFVAVIFYLIFGLILHSSVGWVFILLFPIPLLSKQFLRTIVDFRPLVVLLIAWSL